jgi:hypothetical protein
MMRARRELPILVIAIVLGANTRLDARDESDTRLGSLKTGSIWLPKASIVSTRALAELLAPILWYAIDEPNTIDVDDKPGPQPLPTGGPDGPSRVVYFQIRSLTPIASITSSASQLINFAASRREIDVSSLSHLAVRYFFYYSQDVGFHGHRHDLESATVYVDVSPTLFKGEPGILLSVRKVTGAAHGVGWYSNTLVLSDSTKFPLTLLVEEGKHATSPDGNDDGFYTPGVDVNVNVRDAWGIRDTVHSGLPLYSAFHQSMMRPRVGTRDVGFRVGPEQTAAVTDLRFEIGHGPEGIRLQVEALYALIDVLDVCESLNFDQKDIAEAQRLEHFIADIRFCAFSPGQDGYGSIWERFQIGYRIDQQARGFALSAYSVPIGKGWLILRWSLLGGLLDPSRQSIDFFYSPSASRWWDWYAGMGWDLDLIKQNVSDRSIAVVHASEALEAGWKFRVRPGRWPFVGVRIGVRTNGWTQPRNARLVAEVGAASF